MAFQVLHLNPVRFGVVFPDKPKFEEDIEALKKLSHADLLAAEIARRAQFNRSKEGGEHQPNLQDLIYLRAPGSIRERRDQAKKDD